MAVAVDRQRYDPFESNERIRSVLLQGENVAAKRQEILENFHRGMDAMETLFECFKTDDTWYNRPCSLRHPHLWYYGHTACFYINKLRVGKVLSKPVHPEFEALFAIGVDEMSWDDKLADREWPAMSELKKYRRDVRSIVDEIIQTVDFTLPITWNDPMWVVCMTIDHERIHLETSSVLIRQTDINLLKPHPTWIECKVFTPAPKNELISVSGTHVEYGKNHDDSLYGWDNEYGEMSEDVSSFKASKYLTSNQEYLEFMLDGGYKEQKNWTKEGWRWVQTTKSTHPTFWVLRNVSSDYSDKNSWKLRNMTTEIDMAWSWPVVTNNLEAKAFCNWKAAKTGKNIHLITEGQWHALRQLSDFADVDEPNWNKAPGNINLEYFASECPVDYFPSGNGFYDVIGNVWQHSESQFFPFEGFRTHPVYDDFSVPCFDNKHSMIKGGSWVSTGNEATKLARYAFRRHFFQHAGFRYVESNVELKEDNVVPPRTKEVLLQLDMHYNRFNHCQLPNFLKTVVEKAVAVTNPNMRRRALDVGCGVGRGTFELGMHFDFTLGLDLSTAHIGIGIELQERSYITYDTAEEGEINSIQTRTMMEMELEDSMKKVEFLQNDAHVIMPAHKNFDFVLCANVLDELNQPKHFLEHIHERMSPEGILAIASCNDWDVSKTPREFWLGGIPDSETGEPISTLDGIRNIIGGRFEQIGKAENIPFVTKIHSRKFDYKVAEFSLWRYRSRQSRL